MKTLSTTKSLSLETEKLELLVFDDMDKAEKPWRALEADGRAYVFQTYDWLTCWQRNIGEAGGIEPCIIWAGTASGKGLMLLPFGIEHRRGCRVLVWLGAPLADYRAPVLAKGSDRFLRDFAQSIWPLTLKALPKVDYIHLTSQPTAIDGQANPLLELAHRALPYRAHATVLEGDWESFYRRKRSSKSRNTERRKAKKLGGLGKLSFQIAREPAMIERMLEALGAQKSLRLQEKGAADLFAIPGLRDFLQDLTLTQQNRVQLAALTLDDQIIAVHWGALYRGRFYFLLPALDTGDFASFSPGSLLINHLIEWAFAEGLDLFDFTIGDESYKASWCERHEPIYETVLAISPRGHVATRLLELDALIRQRIRSQPWLYATAAAIRQRLAAARRVA